MAADKANGKAQAKAMAAKAKVVKASKSSKSTGLSIKGKIFLICIVLVGLVFLPTSLLLFIGMLPTISALFLGTRRKIKVSTIAALNLLGCMPFIIKLWGGENNFEASFTILSTPLTIVVIYGAALMGYVLDWGVTGVVSAYMYQKAERRVRVIEKRQEMLVEVWGSEVAAKDKPKVLDDLD